MTDVPPSASAGRARRWLLIASLALNVFFIGGLVSVASHRFTRPPPTPADRTLEARIDRLTNSLPPQDAALLQTQFKAVEATVERARQASRDAQQNVRVALTAPTFDPDAATQALGALREARERIWIEIHSALVKAAIAMSPEGRERLARWIPSGETGPEQKKRPK